ncbi:MAG: protein translocase subunit SecF [Deltaproteobacteria bacterium]|nr:protein translocase subunit SecF [Deltaproteobacteria bacterium]
MEMIKPGTYIDFMAHKNKVIGVSLLLAVLSLASLFFPGPNYGIDFAGGTELQLQFGGQIGAGEVRHELETLGYRRPDVVQVEGGHNEYIIRVREVSAIPEAQATQIRSSLEGALPEGNRLTRFKLSPGGDKITVETTGAWSTDDFKAALEAAGLEVRTVNALSPGETHPYEAHLVGIADEIVRGLDASLGERGPQTPRSVEWVGPKAGQQLRDAAVKALLYAIAFIMVYVAFRFDLRFAPGGIVALLHDVLITLGIYVLVQKEVNLTTVAALLTILGYSINDTIVVYDRIRENMGRLRDKSLSELINISTSQMLSRTIVTSGTTLLSVMAFFIWGTPVIQDISFALFCGILLGTFSSIFIAAPITEWMDTRFFNKASRA